MNNEQVPALRQAVESMATMREAYDNLSQAADAYNTGKTQLAQAITSKGVETSPTESYPEMAEKVNAISQETYEINGGEMYAKQLFGSLETPNYWNLYEVLAQLLSDGRLVNYGGILLAEYYRGYDSLALSGAGAGGAYVVSDLDENGQFIMYTSDTTHTWDTAFDGKGNRWVAYCFADEYHDFQITDTNTSLRSIFIGRKVGTITCCVNTRVSKIVVPDGNKLRNFISGNFTAQWDKNVVIRNIDNINGELIKYSGSVESIYVEAENLTNGGTVLIGTNQTIAPAIFVKANNIIGKVLGGTSNYLTYPIFFVESPYMSGRIFDHGGGGTCAVKNVVFKTEEMVNVDVYISLNDAIIDFLYISNDKSKSVNFYGRDNNLPAVIRLQNGWCKPISFAPRFFSMTEENMYLYILQRLKQDEPDCGDGVTITLGATNLAKLTSAESVQLLDDLTNIYGYTFA